MRCPIMAENGSEEKPRLEKSPAFKELMEVITAIAHGQYSDRIMALTKDSQPQAIKLIAESIALMMVKVEGREYKLEQLNHDLKVNILKTVFLLFLVSLLCGAVEVGIYSLNVGISAAYEANPRGFIVSLFLVVLGIWAILCLLSIPSALKHAERVNRLRERDLKRFAGKTH